jgi:hypothetical protein
VVAPDRLAWKKATVARPTPHTRTAVVIISLRLVTKPPALGRRDWAFVSGDEVASLAAARFALVKLFDGNRSIQGFISAFEIDVADAHQIALGIAHQPVSRSQMENAAGCLHFGRFFHLNCIYQNRFDRPVNHMLVNCLLGPYFRPESIRFTNA